MITSGQDCHPAGYSNAALRDLARRALPRPVFDFADGGAEDERPLRRNRAAFASVDLGSPPLAVPAERRLAIRLVSRGDGGHAALAPAAEAGATGTPLR